MPSLSPLPFVPPVTDRDHLLSAYTYNLPEARIAQHAGPRGASRLMVLDRATGERAHAAFADLATHLPPRALLVANNSCVVPARLTGTRPGGGKSELLLLTPLPLLTAAATPAPDGATWSAEAEVLLKPAKAMRPGTTVTFAGERPDDALLVDILDKGLFGRHRVRLTWQGEQNGQPRGAEGLKALLLRRGKLPLPPYIRREPTAEDAARYQTVYARQDKAGSVAAPTAGLHFTPELRAALAEQGFGWAEVTLHVGYGTFSPVRCEDVREHVMHREFVEVSPETADAVTAARAEGRPVVAVGTTACRTLEGVASQCGHLQPFAGWTDIFIRPGYAFRVVDGLITNFHLPESTLVMLVAALTGRERLLSAYEEAVDREYRFFSYGDAMLVR